jgi:hypothetical protein
MGKSPGFSVGLFAGVLLMFGGSMVPARAVEPAQSVDNQGKYALAVGGSEPNRHDMLWVLHEHPQIKKERGADDFLKPNQITLALYKVERQGEKMKLVAARDIAYDIELQNLNQEKPDARDTFDIYVKEKKAHAK